MQLKCIVGPERRRGAVLYIVAMMIVVFLGIAGLAIDTGIWFVARSEAQRAAEAGAHAGASILVNSSGDEAGARAEAELFAERNQVRGITPDVLPDQDIDVILDSQKVRVRVHRTVARGNPVPTIFARAMGIDRVDIGTMAAAQAWPGIATDCILPFAIPDRWMEWDPDLFGPGVGGHRPSQIGDVYDGPTVDDPIPPGPVDGQDYYDEAVTGYSAIAVGEVIQLTTALTSEAPQPGWYYPIALPGTVGGADYREAIYSCWEPAGDHYLGDYVDKEPGNMVGPTRQGFKAIFDEEPPNSQVWDPVLEWPVYSPGGEKVPSSSRRIRPLVMFDPRTWPDIDMGRKPVAVTNIAGIWMEYWDGNNAVWVRWLHYTAVAPAEEWGDSNDSFLRILRIVE